MKIREDLLNVLSVEGSQVLAPTRKVATIIMDKAVTVTADTMRVVSVIGVDGADRDQLLMPAAAREDASDQPEATKVPSPPNSSLPSPRQAPTRSRPGNSSA